MAWAFTTFHSANWHPLTWLSHMIDSQIFGLNAGGHLFVSALIHVSNTVILFFFLTANALISYPPQARFGPGPRQPHTRASANQCAAKIDRRLISIACSSIAICVLPRKHSGFNLNRVLG
jgi:hypothetical protein